MRSIVFIIRGEATPYLLPITSYFPKPQELIVLGALGPTLKMKPVEKLDFL